MFAQWEFTKGDGFFPFVFACSFDADLRVPLGANWDLDQVKLPRLSGSMVAYEVHFYCCQSLIRVRDLRDGGLVHRIDEVNETEGNGNIYVRSLVVNQSGSVAWIVLERIFGASPQPELSIQVWAVDSSGRRMLDSGTDIEPRSLRLSGSTLSWTKAGGQRFGRLD